MAAQAAKDKGNAAFKAGDYPLAIGHYTAAIMADAREPTYALNRAAAYLKLGKYEDAERDCSTVLSLSKDNVKALFRRGQARAGTSRLSEAREDFAAVLRAEPENAAARDELRRVEALVEQEKAKRKQKATVAAAGAAAPPVKRRVPIRIIDPAAGPSTGAETGRNIATSAATDANSSTAPAAAAPAPASPAPQPKTLEAVSSRALKSPAAPAPKAPAPAPTPSPSAIPPALAAAAAALQPQAQEKGNEKREPKDDEIEGKKDAEKEKGKGRAAPESFAQAKEARASAKPSRVGGGIFRASGASTVFAPRGAKASRSGVEEVREEPAPAPVPAAPSPSPWALKTGGQLAKAPTTLFDFTRAWNALKSAEEKWALMTTIPPDALPKLCGTALEPAQLAGLLSVFRAALAGDASVQDAVRAYMAGLARIPRFGTLVLLLSAGEKADARAVFEALGERPGGAWVAVG